MIISLLIKRDVLRDTLFKIGFTCRKSNGFRGPEPKPADLSGNTPVDSVASGSVPKGITERIFSLFLSY